MRKYITLFSQSKILPALSLSLARDIIISQYLNIIYPTFGWLMLFFNGNLLYDNRKCLPDLQWQL